MELKELTTHFIDSVQEASLIMEEKMIDPDLWGWSNELPIDGGVHTAESTSLLVVARG